MRRLISRFISDTSGATAIEYALIAAGLSIVIAVTVNGLGAKLNNNYTAVNSALK
ncbi:Flp family type IVb pilin [Rhodopseudomonas sp. NSM]|uniref:Flp family type IVb pilin n=1 Tax=Rhodopseudomonas sp. NSM TaxID=3457630 RepID=UPI00403679C3